MGVARYMCGMRAHALATILVALEVVLVGTQVQADVRALEVNDNDLAPHVVGEREQANAAVPRAHAGFNSEALSAQRLAKGGLTHDELHSVRNQKEALQLAQLDQAYEADAQAQLLKAKEIFTKGAKTRGIANDIVRRDETRLQKTQKRLHNRIASLQEKELGETHGKKAVKTKANKSGKDNLSKQALKAKHATQVKKAHHTAQSALDSHHSMHGMSKTAMKQAHDEMKKAAQLSQKLRQASNTAKKAAVAVKKATAKVTAGKHVTEKQVKDIQKRAKRASRRAKKSKANANKKTQQYEKAAKAAKPAKGYKPGSLPHLQHRVSHWTSRVAAAKKEAKEAQTKKKAAYLTSHEHKNKMKAIIVSEVQKGLSRARDQPSTKLKLPSGLAMLQETTVSGGASSSKSAGIKPVSGGIGQASEVAQKAFNWEQQQLDLRAGNKIKAKIMLNKRRALVAREHGFERLRTQEIKEKKQARHEKVKQLKQRASWEAAAKAYSSVEQATKSASEEENRLD